MGNDALKKETKNYELKVEYLIKDIRVQLFKDFDSKRWKIKFCNKNDDKNFIELKITDSYFNKNPNRWRNKRNDEKVIKYLKNFSEDYLKRHNYNINKIFERNL